MKELFKKKGYEVVVTSWENDADNYKTECKHFDSLDEANFVHDLCLKFGSSHSWHFDPNKLGNTQFFRDGHVEKFREAVTNHINNLYHTYDVHTDFKDFDYVDDCILYDLIGIWDDGQQIRVVETVKVVQYPEDVYIDVLSSTTKL